jgi:hypothetical protein
MENKQRVLVVDVPLTLTALATQNALNVEGYYITRMTSLPDEGGCE